MSAKIIIIGSEKGGVGKSTLLGNLAVALLLDPTHRGTLIAIDSDPQQSIQKWADNRAYRIENKEISVPAVRVLSKRGRNLGQEVKALAADLAEGSLILVDVGGADAISLRSALTVADVWIIPMNASQLDADPMENHGDIAIQAATFNPKLKVYVVTNKCLSASASQAKKIIEVTIEQLGKENQGVAAFGTFDTAICQRTAFISSWGRGLSVMEAEKRDAKACSEIAGFYREVLEALE